MKKEGKIKEERWSKQNKRKERKKEVVCGGWGERKRKTERKIEKKERVCVKYLDKRKYCVSSEPSVLLYIGILVTSTTTGHGGSVVSALAAQAKGRYFNSQLWQEFFFPNIFLSYSMSGQVSN